MSNKKMLIFFAFLLILISIPNFSAEKLTIDVNNAKPGDDVKFQIKLYDDNNNPIQGMVSYTVQDFYTDIIAEGKINAWEESSFLLPANTVQGFAKIKAIYNNIQTEQLFSVLESEKAELKLEGDQLIVTNIGNKAFESIISITIGDIPQTAKVYLEIGQTKTIKLTAPDGVYDIKIVDEQGNVIEKQDVTLTGNIVGLESITNSSFFKRYPMIVLFFGVLLFLAVVIFFLKKKKQ